MKYRDTQVWVRGGFYLPLCALVLYMAGAVCKAAAAASGAEWLHAQSAGAAHHVLHLSAGMRVHDGI